MRKVKVLIQILAVIIAACFAFNLDGCRLKRSNLDFQVCTISNIAESEYFTSDNLRFTRIGNAAILPRIREIAYDEYTIFIFAYAQAEESPICVENVTLTTEDGTVCFQQDVNKMVEFQERKDGMWEGWISCDSFWKPEVKMTIGQKLMLSIQIQTDAETEISKTINYNIEIYNNS